MVEQPGWEYQPNAEIPEGESLPEGVTRIALGVEYDGSPYSGWQYQPHSPSVQAVLDNAIARVANEPTTSVCAGRTDAGVHAVGQVVHFDSRAPRSERNWLLGINSNLPSQVAVRWVRTVPAAFHARFSASSRRYRYLMSCSVTRPALLARQLTWVREPLDVAAMREALPSLLGEHDFSSFRASGCQAHSPVRRVDAIEIGECGDLLWLDITANAFLHHMVRNIVGALLEIGRGERSSRWMAELLSLRDRKLGSPTAPPWGLYLLQVDYPQSFALPVAPPAWMQALVSAA